MRVVHVNASDSIGGAARSAYRLHAGLVTAGHDSLMFAKATLRDDRTVHAARSMTDRIWPLLRERLDRLPTRLYPRRARTLFTVGVVPSCSAEQLVALRPDILHLHWLGPAFVDLGALRRLDVPVVWTLHDSWAFTGGCHVPQECERFRDRCGRCPALGSGSPLDLSTVGWHRKRRALRQLQATVVTPSAWMAARASASSLLGGARVEVIPNGIDAALFRPIDKGIAREILGIPSDAPVLLYGAMFSALDPNKGLDLLGEALGMLSHRGVPAVRLLVMGSTGVKLPQKANVEVTCIGMVHDEAMVALANNAADAVVLPSRQENFPNAALEAAACARPVAAFDIGGVPEIVKDGETGFLAQPFDPDSLAGAIGRLLADRALRDRLGARAREVAKREWGAALCANRHVELYRSILGTTHGKGRCR